VGGGLVVDIVRNVYMHVMVSQKGYFVACCWILYIMVG
jgi:hypothetical protein